MTDEVRVVALLKAQPGSGAGLLAQFRDLAPQVRAEEGCLGYDLHRVVGDDDRFVVLERWASLDALAAHGRSPHMRAFGASAAEVLAGAPEVIVLPGQPDV